MAQLAPSGRDVLRIIAGTSGEVRGLYARLADDVLGIISGYPERPLTDLERASMMRRIDGVLEGSFGVSAERAKDGELYGIITRGTDAAAEAPFRRTLAEIERGVISRRGPETWERVHVALMSGGVGRDDPFAAVYSDLNGPYTRKMRRLRAGMLDPQRRWVPKDKWTTKRGYRLSDRVWRAGRGYRGWITRDIREAIRNGDGPLTLAKRLERYFGGTDSQAAYAARRLARTELARVHHYATRALMQSGIPGGRGVRWNLSLSHPQVDICDDYATDDDHDLGAGIYPAADCPEIPHPQCLCYLTPVMRSRAEVLDEIIARYGF